MDEAVKSRRVEGFSVFLNFVIFIVILFADLLTTEYGLKMGFSELNPFPFEIALVLRFCLFLILLRLGRPYVAHLFYLSVVINNFTVFFYPKLGIVMILVVYISGYVIILTCQKKSKKLIC